MRATPPSSQRRYARSHQARGPRGLLARASALPAAMAHADGVRRAARRPAARRSSRRWRRAEGADDGVLGLALCFIAIVDHPLGDPVQPAAFLDGLLVCQCLPHGREMPPDAGVLASFSCRIAPAGDTGWKFRI